MRQRCRVVQALGQRRNAAGHALIAQRHQAQQVIALPARILFRLQRAQAFACRQRPGVLRRFAGRLGKLLFDPLGHGLIVPRLLLDRAVAVQPRDLALRVLVAVGQPLLVIGQRDLRRRVLRARALHHPDQLAEEVFAADEEALAPLLHLLGDQRAPGDPGITEHHDDVFFLEPLGRNREEKFGFIRLGPAARTLRRRAVVLGPDPGDGEIAGVARPRPVVDLAAVLADRPRRRIDEAHVAQLGGLDQRVIHPVVEGRHRAFDAGLLLACLDQRLLRRLDRLQTLQRRHPGGHRGEHLRGHVGEALGNFDAQRAARQLFGRRARQEALGDQIALRRAVFLHHAEQAVMVADDEPGFGDEGTGTAAHLDGAGEQPRPALGIPKRRRRQHEPLLFEPLGADFEDLAGRPFTVERPSGRGSSEAEQQGRENVFAHDLSRVDEQRTGPVIPHENMPRRAPGRPPAKRPAQRAAMRRAGGSRPTQAQSKKERTATGSPLCPRYLRD